MTQLKEKIRTVTFLNRHQIDFLDKLGKDALFYRGTKLSRVEILSELVEFLMGLGIDIKKVNITRENLARELLKVINNNHYEDKKEDEQKSVLV